MNACTTRSITTDAATPPIDLTALADLVDGDSAFEQELIDDFIHCVRTSLEESLLAIRERDLTVVQHSAHGVKGASANLHAAVMYSLAEQLEIAAKSGNSAAASDLVNALDSELQRTIEFLSKRTG